MSVNIWSHISRPKRVRRTDPSQCQPWRDRRRSDKILKGFTRKILERVKVAAKENRRLGRVVGRVEAKSVRWLKSRMVLRKRDLISDGLTGMNNKKEKKKEKRKK